eukprot:g29108.t1
MDLDKCEVMHLGRTDKSREYMMDGRALGNTEDQRDPDVVGHHSLNVPGQADKVVLEAFGILAFMSRGIEFKSKEVMLGLCKTL